MKFLSCEVSLYLYKSTILPCMEYIWAGAPSCYLDLLDISYKKGCARLLVFHLLLLLNPWPMVEIRPAEVFFIGITLVDVLQNWLKFHFLFFEVGLLVILVNCMIFLSPFVDVTRMSMSTVAFFAQLGSGILCL